VAGGGEDDETPLQTAARETLEEIGVDTDKNFRCLESQSAIPRNCFAASAHWDRELIVIPEYHFAVDVAEREPVLSNEHTEYMWKDCATDLPILKWESNRIALQELDQYLRWSL